MTDKQPETPDELLREEIASFLLEQNRGTYPKSTYSNQADYILLKCHQSEAARITELETDVKEWKSIANARDKMVDVACAEARADQNKKIGEYIEHWYDEWDDISSWNAMRRFVSQLELGKFSPEEAVK
jgi:hypothetical protein